MHVFVCVSVLWVCVRERATHTHTHTHIHTHTHTHTPRCPLEGKRRKNNKRKKKHLSLQEEKKVFCLQCERQNESMYTHESHEKGGQKEYNMCASHQIKEYESQEEKEGGEEKVYGLLDLQEHQLMHLKAAPAQLRPLACFSFKPHTLD